MTLFFRKSNNIRLTTPAKMIKIIANTSLAFILSVSEKIKITFYLT